jgi:hypothetical protein
MQGRFIGRHGWEKKFLGVEPTFFNQFWCLGVRMLCPFCI